MLLGRTGSTKKVSSLQIGDNARKGWERKASNQRISGINRVIYAEWARKRKLRAWKIDSGSRGNRKIT
jgi:hypothetical protein